MGSISEMNQEEIERLFDDMGRYAAQRDSRSAGIASATALDLHETVCGADEELRDGHGIVYILGTGVYTDAGKRIVKIGYTTQPVVSRIRQLYTTGAMFQFEEIASYRVASYTLLEQALHKLLAPFRLNEAREFFSEDAMQFVREIVEIHERIQAAAEGS